MRILTWVFMAAMCGFTVGWSQEPPTTPPPAKQTEDKKNENSRRLTQLKIEVKEEGGGPVVNAEVRVKNADGSFDRRVVTDANGTAAFPDVPRASIRIEVLHLEFETKIKREDLSQADQTVTVSLRKPQDL